MASNDEYQQQQFWEDRWLVFYHDGKMVYAVNESKHKKEASDYEAMRLESERNLFFAAPLDNVAWTKTGQGWEFKTK